MTLYGREAECSTLDALTAGSHVTALVLRGAAGSGKTALLDYAARHAAGRRVLRASGVAAESELAWAGLHQLLGLSGLPPDPMQGGIALLEALSEIAEREPLLCLVDDAQLLDEQSLAAIAFAARRLSAQEVVLLLAAGEPLPHSLPELWLAPLDRESAGRWLDERLGEALSPLVRDRLIGEASGNPLALTELAGALSAEQLAGRARLPGPLPVAPQAVESLVARVRALGTGARQVLLIAAAADSASTADVWAAAQRVGLGRLELEELEWSGLVRTRDDRLAFAHPLLRSAAYHSASLFARRTAHEALADVVESAGRRAWHRAAIALGADADAADALEHAAPDARRRRGVAAAADALARAAALTPNEASPDRSRRLLAAADAAQLAGETARASALFGEAARAAAEPAEREAIAERRGDPFRELRATLAASADVRPLITELRDEGAAGGIALALEWLAVDELAAGRFTEAAVAAAEGLRLALHAGLRESASRHRGILAWVAAARGREDECRALALEAFELEPELATAALGELELGLGRHERALAQFRLLRFDDDQVLRLVAPSIVEAAARGDDRAFAEDVTARFEATGSADPALLDRCRALLTTGARAYAHFCEAVRLHAASGRAFDRARTELLFGEELRRTRQRRRARSHLQASLDLFEKVGAESWASRARSELRSSGLTARRGDASLLDQLTQQELQVARLVGAGSTNKEVAAQLFLSPRTIDFHLRNVFAKLGITSRMQLAWFRLEDEEPGGESGGFAGATARRAA